MIPLPLSDVARLAAAEPAGVADLSAQITSVEVDSRRAGPGTLFVALPGERTDGHDHAPTAVEAGAVAVLSARPLDGLPCLVAPDPLEGLQALAAGSFSVEQPWTVGITGSSGKTSTKDLLASVLRGLLGDEQVLAPQGSFNNELGLPLTLLRRTERTEAAVLEYSARGTGHIAFLCGLARPHVAVELNVGSAHLGEFGSPEGIAKAKGELVEAVAGPDPVVVLNADDARVAAMRERAPSGARVVTYGAAAAADVRIEDLELDEDGRPRFVLATSSGSVPVHLQLRGEHSASNAAAAAAVVLGGRPGTDLQQLAALLGNAAPASRWRMEVVERPDGVTVVNDAYNANPDSMRAALKTLAVLSRGKTRRTWAVLGHMAELGDSEREAHMDLGRFVVRLDVSRLVVVGPDAGGIHAGAVLEGSWGEESAHVDDVEEAVRLLRAELWPGDVVLVKGSRSAGLERVADALLAEPAPGTRSSG
ncbi:MAG TPA: UDP-N-acetylmuramoyl-tripeptide--D-alanyl-D-alanine ligase [Mycobacteriales bacterium]|nr:UDP-N-acetylmuramoyl-tripeptide--D-alanyl-D-alanine ligase [Mycobacteriales bacterium]